jgi:hypothetical protein
VFPVRYELDLYILFRRNRVFKGLTKIGIIQYILMTFSDFRGVDVRRQTS